MAYIENPRPVNRCQYWVLDEPDACIYWSNDNVCTYKKTTTVVNSSVIVRGDLYPFCNYIGTSKNKCTKYSTTTSGSSPRCVLPDPYRHIAKSPHCDKWIVPTATSSGTYYLDYSPINGYNSGQCNYDSDEDDTGGTEVTCSGFTAHHLGFVGTPIPEKCVISGTEEITEPKLPLNYDLMNFRSELGMCRWWQLPTTPSGEHYLFKQTWSPEKFSYFIKPPEFRCNNPSAVAQTYDEFFEDLDNLYYRPPCNGATPDCPKYTGNLASTGYLPYLSSIFMRDGDKIMAEQILELRYNIKKETWDSEYYDKLFGEEAIIYAHEGTTPEITKDSDNTILDYSIASIKTEIKDFNCFAIERTKVLLTKGTMSDNYKTDFNTLIKELRELPLSPIIRSTFENIYALSEELSYQQKREYIFETSYTDDVELLIVGDHFSDGDVDSDYIFAINTSDEEIGFPFKEMLKFRDMFEFKVDKGINFAARHLLLVRYLNLLREIAPDKVFYNEWNDNSRSFAIGVKTIFGENTIVVFDTSKEIYSFAVIKVRVSYCGGVVAQTGFSVEHPDNVISEIFDYEKYNCLPMFKPEVSYKFKAFYSPDSGGAIPYHSYMDTKSVVLHNPMSMVDSSTVILGYKMYKIRVVEKGFFVDNCDTTTISRLIFLGNSGTILVVIDDKLKLHSVIRNWDTGEVNESGNPKPMELVLKGTDSEGKEQSIKMDILEYCTDRLEVNQMLLKPKNITEYVRLYGPSISFTNGLFVYERWSFGLVPNVSENDFEEVFIDYSENDSIIRPNSTLQGSLSSECTIKNLPTAPIIISIIFMGFLTKRIKGQAKSDLMTYVKQAFCSDVEINYTWTANYQRYILTPTHYCFVSGIGVIYDEPEADGSLGYPMRSYTPYCGDHNFGRTRQRPASMWYPYEQCDEYASYSLYYQAGERDYAPMEFWLDDVGRPIVGQTSHGSHDLRMLGPAENFGMTVDVHTSIWACGCDWTHANLNMLTSPWFTGHARIRAGVEGEALYYMTQNGGQPPKFGNKKRGYLMSFRATVALSYYIVTDYGIDVERKWLPPYEGFSDIRIDKSFKEYPWNHYFNTSDNIVTYYSQFGLLGAVDVENISVGEKLVFKPELDESGNPTGKDSTTLKRYRFTDIFEGHHTTLGLVYPSPRKVYTLGQSENPITAWLTYRSYQDDMEKAIQWAWRERWKPLERGFPDIRTIMMGIASDGTGEYDPTDFHMSYLSFLGVSYANYTYNYLIEEFRRVPVEGSHTLYWEPSIRNPDHPLPTHFLLSLDNGPVRLFDPEIKLITESVLIDPELEFESMDTEEVIKHTDFYKICSEYPWLNTVTCSTDLESMDNPLGNNTFMLYTNNTEVVESEEEAKTNAEEGDRKVVTTDGIEKVDLYFNRGLVLDVKYGMTTYLPKIIKKLEIEYEFKLSEQAHDDSIYSTINIEEYYPVNSPLFGMVYEALKGNDVTLTFRFVTPVVLAKVEILYNTGEVVIDNVLEIKEYYNMPKINIKKSIDDQEYTDLFDEDYTFAEKGEEMGTVNKEYEFDYNDLTYMSELYSNLSLTFNYSPKEDDFIRLNFDNKPFYTHFMDIRSITLYVVEYTNMHEVVTTHERKFNISVGGYGTYPVHGFDHTGSLLYPDPFILSTVYQRDNALGMVGMPNSTGEFTSISKLRGRLASELEVDGVTLEGDLADFEAKQKLIFDDIALSGSENMQLKSLAGPVLKEALSTTKASVFPRWVCSLENKNMLPLKKVTPKKKYYPEGHQWTWGLENVRDFYNCGGGGKRKWKTLFDYKWGRISGLYGWVYAKDAVFDVYVYGMMDAIANWASHFDLPSDW